MLQATTLEFAGLRAALEAVRLPHNGSPKSEIHYELLSTGEFDRPDYLHQQCEVALHPKDILLMQNLIRSGDQHAKVVRGIVVWAKITAPIYWWCELETNIVGHQRLSSESTMHTEGKGLYGEELQKVKAAIPMGRELTKVDYFSYQTLRRIVHQRHNHRLPEWQEFIQWVKSLPLADELILHALTKDNGDPELPK